MAKKWFPYNNFEYVEECLKAYLDLLDLLNKAITEKEKEKEKLTQKKEIQRASKVDTSN